MQPSAGNRKAQQAPLTLLSICRSLSVRERGGGMADYDLYRRQVVEHLEREKRAAQDEIVRAQADEARARARVAEKDSAIARVYAALDPQPDECRRCRFEFGRTSVLRPMPSKSKVARLQCSLCGDEEERA